MDELDIGDRRQDLQHDDEEQEDGRVSIDVAVGADHRYQQTDDREQDARVTDQALQSKAVLDGAVERLHDGVDDARYIEEIIALR